jgi:hypothetical protein
MQQHQQHQQVAVASAPAPTGRCGGGGSSSSSSSAPNTHSQPQQRRRQWHFVSLGEQQAVVQVPAAWALPLLRACVQQVHGEVAQALGLQLAAPAPDQRQARTGVPVAARRGLEAASTAQAHQQGAAAAAGQLRAAPLPLGPSAAAVAAAARLDAAAAAAGAHGGAHARGGAALLRRLPFWWWWGSSMDVTHAHHFAEGQ